MNIVKIHRLITLTTSTGMLFSAACGQDYSLDGMAIRVLSLGDEAVINCPECLGWADRPTEETPIYPPEDLIT